MPEKDFSEVDWPEDSAFRPLADHGFYPYSGADGDLFRKHGVPGWRVSVRGRHSIKIQKKSERKFGGRYRWTTIREWQTEPDATDEYTPIEDVGELPVEAIEKFEEVLVQLVEDGGLPTENEDYVYEPKQTTPAT